MPEPKPDNKRKPASSPDELVKDLDVKLSEEEQDKVKGRDAKIGFQWKPT